MVVMFIHFQCFFVNVLVSPPISILVDNLPSRMLIDEREGTLKIRKVCKDCDVAVGSTERLTDLMVIQCNASNVHGYTFGQGYINVLSE